MKPLEILSALSAAFAYLLVALSPIVRITGSGMGCGDDWPLCNGRIFPPLDDLGVMIEWGHRLAAAGVSLFVAVVAIAAYTRRNDPGFAGPGGILRPAVLALVLLISQVLLGAVTVWFELPTPVVVLHMSNALALLAAVFVTAFRAFAVDRPAMAVASHGAFRTARVAAVLGGVALLLGALTANMDAGMACTGFPLCSGAIWPSGGGGGGLAHIHWTHRLVAYALVLHMIGVLITSHRKREPRGVVIAAWLDAAVLSVHVLVAVLRIARPRPLPLRPGHAGRGPLVWVSRVWLTWRAAPGRAAWS
jgi:heme A synthase